VKTGGVAAAKSAAAGSASEGWAMKNKINE
jgi:hypothetical protein